jgi:hypothetical protein
MRGSPLLNALLAFLAIGLLGYPVYRLTRATALASAPAATKAAAPLVKVPVEWQFTVPPKSVRLRHLGKTVWSADAPGASADAALTIPWPDEGVDLLVEIAWPDDAPLAAARIVLTNPAGDELTRSIWGRGTTSEVLTFR